MNYENMAPIALIEDDKVLSDSIYTGLTDEGFRVERAFDGESGLALVLDKKPSLILLDILMPKMDGLTMVEQIKNNPATKNIPIIILTVLENAKPVAKALGLGVHEYFIKSDNKIADIVNRVKEHFNESN
jgi:DNA-binding response OmpR family regulator